MAKGFRIVVLALAAILAMQLPSCKKDETFKIERKWRVVSVTRQGLPLENFSIKAGDEYEFKSNGEYTFNGSVNREGRYSLDLSNKSLLLDNDEYYVYYAQEGDFSFGMLSFKEDYFTLVLKAK